MYALLLIAALASAAFGQDKPQLTPADFRDFSGGLVDSVDPLYLQANQSPDIRNVVIDGPRFAVTPRNGFSRVGTLPSGNSATNLFSFTHSNGNKYFIATDNQNIYATMDFVTWTTIKTGLSNGIVPQFVSVRDKVWVMSGSTWTFTWNTSTTQLLDGTAGTPNPGPPVCRYPEFYKERVFCGRSLGYPSGVQWSALEDNAGNDLDPSTGTASWPATFVINVNQDAGTPLVGLKAYRSRLYAFKEDGIYEIEFADDFNNGVVKISPVGVKFNTSVWEKDNLLYFVGVDGIYAFDGESAVRISDDIKNTFESINQLSATERLHQWTSKADWGLGTFSNCTNNDTYESVTLSSYTRIIPDGDFEESSDWVYWSSSTAGTVYLGTYAYSGYGDAARITATCNYVGGDCGNLSAVLHAAGGAVLKDVTGDLSVSASTVNLDMSDFEGQTGYFKFRVVGNWGSNVAELQSSTFTIKKQISIFADKYVGAGNAVGWLVLDNFYSFEYLSTGTFTSDIYNMVSVSTYSTFEAEYTPNGGTVLFWYRTGANAPEISTSGWRSIIPGNSITGSSSHTLFQFLSSMTATADLQKTPEIMSVGINWYQGSANTKPVYMRDWSNRLWITASTGSATNHNMVLVKSIYPSKAFVPYDLQVGPMVQFNGKFYAGASTHSAIYRLDYGTSDEGRAIDWYATTRDEVWGFPWHFKQLYEVSSDFRKGTASNAYVGYSTDGGVSFTEKTVNMSGTGRGTDRRFLGSGKSQAYRLKFGSRTKDDTATILGVTGWAFPEQLRR